MHLDDQKEGLNSDEFLAEIDKMRQKELQRVAETVTEMLGQMIDMIAMEAAASQSDE